MASDKEKIKKIKKMKKEAKDRIKELEAVEDEFPMDEINQMLLEEERIRLDTLEIVDAD